MEARTLPLYNQKKNNVQQTNSFKKKGAKETQRQTDKQTKAKQKLTSVLETSECSLVKRLQTNKILKNIVLVLKEIVV